ncbi:MAG: transcription elongation factor GreA [Oscillospiraceae bacterium]|nr:transcription elongation factor GreA [Oscillospiraceae bacterium]
MSNAIKLTKEGLESLEQELEELKSTKRKEIAEKIKVALSFGDLSENSEYDEAKNEQAIMEARIADLEAMLKNAEVIDETAIDTDKVSIGARVLVRVRRPSGEEMEKEYRIVGSNEANPREGRISDESAIGKALIGTAMGDHVEVEVPAGLMQYEVLSIMK